MTRQVPPTPSEVNHWIRQDPQAPRFLMGDDATAFRAIRQPILKRLLRDPEMWWRQLLNSLGGCCRYLGLLVVGIPTLHFWASLILEASDPEPSAPPVPPGWMEQMPPGAEPSFLTAIVMILALFGIIDYVMGGRIGGFRSVFGERAERIAWQVWDQGQK